MRIATALLSTLLLLSGAGWGQAQGTSNTGHFEGWLSRPQWGADKLAFEGLFGIRQRAATFTVAENGFGWRISFTGSEGTFSSWEDVTAWCWAPGTVLFRTSVSTAPGLGIYELEPEDLSTLVEMYFKKYAPEAEWASPGWKCAPAGLAGPNPANMSKILELLEAASSR